MDLSRLGKPGITVTHTSTNAAQQLTDITDMVMKDSDNKNVDKVLITVETNAIAFSWGVDPVQGGVGHRLPSWGEYVGQALVGCWPYLILEGSKSIFDFRFISYAEGSHGVMQVTPFYRTGVK